MTSINAFENTDRPIPDMGAVDVSELEEKIERCKDEIQVLRDMGLDRTAAVMQREVAKLELKRDEILGG